MLVVCSIKYLILINSNRFEVKNASAALQSLKKNYVQILG